MHKTCSLPFPFAEPEIGEYILGNSLHSERQVTMFDSTTPSNIRLPSFTELMTSIPSLHRTAGPPKSTGYILSQLRMNPPPLPSPTSSSPCLSNPSFPTPKPEYHFTYAQPYATVPAPDIAIARTGMRTPPPSGGRFSPPYHAGNALAPAEKPAQAWVPQRSQEPLVQDSKKTHVCKICSRSFTTSGHLARHNRIHTGERKHICPWPTCSARFARQDNCMQHYKTHTNGKSKRAKRFKTALLVAKDL